MLKSDMCIGKQFNFFKNMTFKEKETLQNNSSSLEILKGDVVFFEDELLEKLFCIQEGACKFSLIGKSGKEHITKLLGKGDLMGRRSIITNKGALVTATAITNTTLCLINKETVLQSIHNNITFCQDVVKGFIAGMDEEAEKITYFQNHKSIKIRLAGLLLYLHDKFGIEKNGWINISLKRRDMANILGTTTEYIISLLSSFNKKQYLKVNREKIKIVSNKQLRAMLKTA